MKKIFLILCLGFLFFLSYEYNLSQYARLDFVKANLENFQRLANERPVFYISTFFITYIFVTLTSLPGAAVLMTLVAGATFGFIKGTVIVSFASTIGASLAFLVARYLFRDIIKEKFSRSMSTINNGLAKDGTFYLFTLRLIPIFPFFLINLAMGLTNIPLRTFYYVSQIGMLAGTMAYINAGLQLAKLTSLKGLISFDLLLSFAILGILPLVSKILLNKIKQMKVYKPFRKNKPKKFDFDMIVLGGGAAGLVTAYIGSAVKAKVALIEKNRMGGDCLNTGCVPSKAIIKSAHFIHEAKNSKKLGIKKATLEFNFKDIMTRVRDVIKKIEPHDSVDRYTKLGVECFESHAKITSPWTVSIEGKTLTTRNITIACGAEPFISSIPGLDTVPYSTSDTIWNLKECPKHLVILGGGPIGCELSQVFSRLGAKVTIIQKINRIMAYEDLDVSELISQCLEAEGISLLVEHEVVNFSKNGSSFELRCQNNGKSKIISFDHVLIAVGRKPRVSGYGLEELGIELRNDQTIAVNEFLQTKYPNIFACGDVTGPYQLTHAASHQAWFCAVNGLFGQFKKFKVDYRVLPWCTYTDPEVATVGLNEQTAKKQHIPYEVTKYELSDLDRAITDSTDFGFIKVLTVPGKDKILGATIVGAQASNLILEFVAAMKHGFGLNKILGTIHVYPSLGEANKFAAGNWRREHSNPKVLNMLEKYFKWKRS